MQECKMNAENRIDLQFLYGLKNRGRYAVIQWCMEMSLLASSCACPVCGKNMKIASRRNGSDGYVWCCRRKAFHVPHNIKRSLRTKSMFEKSRLSIINILMISYLWLKRAPNPFIEEELQLALKSIIDAVYYYRELCVEICVFESTVLGGEGIEVEILEKQFSRKNTFRVNQGMRAKGEWIIVGIEKGSSKYFFRIVESNSKAHLLHTIQEWILPGTVIISTCIKKNHFIANRQFADLKEKYTFQQPESGISMLEDVMKTVRNSITVTYSDSVFNVYLAEYLWRCSHNHNFRSLVKSFYEGIPKIFSPTAATLES